MSRRAACVGKVLAGRRLVDINDPQSWPHGWDHWSISRAAILGVQVSKIAKASWRWRDKWRLVHLFCLCRILLSCCRISHPWSCWWSHFRPCVGGWKPTLANIWSVIETKRVQSHWTLLLSSRIQSPAPTNQVMSGWQPNDATPTWPIDCQKKEWATHHSSATSIKDHHATTHSFLGIRAKKQTVRAY